MIWKIESAESQQSLA